MAKSKVEKTVEISLPKTEVEAKPERTYVEAQREFTSLCVNAGNTAYLVFTHCKDLYIMFGKMRDLNFEAAAVKGRETKSGEPTNA